MNDNDTFIEKQVSKKEVLEILYESVKKYESPQTYFDYIRTIFEKVGKL